jgi:hypothetical protein
MYCLVVSRLLAVIAQPIILIYSCEVSRATIKCNDVCKIDVALLYVAAESL